MRPIPLIGALLAAAALALPSPAAAAPTGWHCSASALDGALLGQALPGVVTVGSTTADCKEESFSRPLSLPPLLDASVLAASTKASGKEAAAVGGVADISVHAVPELPIPLPPVQIPEQLKKLSLNLSKVNPLLPAITVDLTPAIEALLPDGRLPRAELLRIQTAIAYANGKCVDGKAQIDGASQIAGIRLLGLDAGTDSLVNQVLTLVDTQNIDLTKLDLSLVKLPVLGPLLDPLLRPAFESVLRPLLATLPPVQVPATLAHVKVTPGAQIRTDDGGVVQRALRVHASIAGVSLADLVVGEAAVSGSGVDCKEKKGDQGDVLPSVDEYLACTKRKIVLIDVLQRRGRVRLIGAADKSLGGRTVKFVFHATGRTAATAKVRANGSFSAWAPLPPASVRSTNDARYRAVVGKERSLNLKLQRRMIVDSVKSSGGKVRIKGRVIRPLASPPRMIVVKRRVTCKTTRVVKRIRPDRNGRFSVTLTAPKNKAAAVYRLNTRVRNNPGNPKLYPTFTLPRAVDL